MTYKLTFSMYYCMVLFFVSIPDATIAQEQTSSAPVAERLTVNVLVVDPDGSPIEGAVVVPRSMVLNNNPGVSYAWLDDQPHMVANLVTDSSGEVALSWRKTPVEGTDVSRIRIAVDHPSFVKYSEWHSTSELEFHVEMQRGCQVAATAVDAMTGEPIRANLYASTNRHDPVDWELKENGTLVSPIFNEDEKSFRLVQLVDGKALRFSELISIDPSRQGRHLMQNVKMFESADVRGKLDDQVPRPIKHGLVIALVASMRDEDLPNQHVACSWTTIAEVAEDGSFIIEGIPADATIQIAAMCDGWVNQVSTDEEFDRHFPAYDKNQRSSGGLPILVNINNNGSDLLLPMQACGSCVVRVVDEKGWPVSNAQVLLGPSQLFFYCPNGPGFDSVRIDAMLLQEMRRIDGTEEKINVQLVYQQFLATHFETDKNGSVNVEYFPVGGGRCYVSHPEFRPRSGSSENNHRFRVESGKQTDLNLILKKTDEPDN